MLNTHLLTARLRAKAVADYGFLGWAVLKQLVDAKCCRDMQLLASRCKFTSIFNADEKSPRNTRAAAKAGPEADALMQSIHSLCKELLIIGDDHLWALGRGSSFLKTPPGCLEQVGHRDFYPFRTVRQRVSAGRRNRPCSVIVALQDNSGVKIYDQEGQGFIVEMSIGDVLVFAGDVPHNGLESRAHDDNVRLFAYFPTRLAEVPWSTKGCEESRINVNKHEVQVGTTTTPVKKLKLSRGAVASCEEDLTVDRLLDLTDPQLHTFRSEEYGKFLYDRMKSKFYHFSYEMWYSGIDTAKIRPEDKSVHTGCCSRYASSVPVVARDLYSHCEHFLQDDFWFDLADPDPDSKVDRRKAWKALLSKYRKDCAYCVPCKAQ
jgi:hypothetical protein